MKPKRWRVVDTSRRLTIYRDIYEGQKKIAEWVLFTEADKIVEEHNKSLRP